MLNTDSAIKHKTIDINLLQIYITNQQLSLIRVLEKLKLLESSHKTGISGNTVSRGWRWPKINEATWRNIERKNRA